MKENFAVEVQNITKQFPGTLALNDVSLGFQKGKVHAVIGKNGAGKSTLVKILSGAYTPTSGSIFIDGEPVDISTPAQAQENGIVTVYQELSLIPHLSVTENILLGRLPKKRSVIGISVVDWDKAREIVSDILHRIQLDVSPDTTVSSLSVAQQQLVEIAKAISMKARLLILDEPTSALSHESIERLFEVIQSLKNQGVSLIYISHRLQELTRIADDITVMRDGQVVGVIPGAESSPKLVAEMMFGETISLSTKKTANQHGDVVLDVKNLTLNDRLKNISFQLHRGEVLGIAGLLGSGRSELLRCIMGADSFNSGSISIDGTAVESPTVSKMTKLGFGMTPENRKEEGLVLQMSVRDNACLANLSGVAKNGIITKAMQYRLVDKAVADYDIKVSNPEVPVESLSGGNQQKVIIADWLSTKPKVMMFDEPTRGIDVQAKAQIFRIIEELSNSGVACLFVSSELEEVMEVSHRVLVLKDGVVSNRFETNEITINQLFEACV